MEFSQILNRWVLSIVCIGDKHIKCILYVFPRCGSVEVDYQMVFATPTPQAPTQLAQMLQQSIQTNGLVSQDGTNFTVDAASIVFEGTPPLPLGSVHTKP